MEELEEKKRKLLSLIPDLLADFFYYDRADSEFVSLADLKRLTNSGLIDYEILKEAFSEALFDIMNE